MNKTIKVRFWELQKKTGRRRPHGVRWVTEDKEHSEWFVTKALAERRRSDLMQAARHGEAFDINSGWPESEYKARNSRSLLKLTQDFIDGQWPNSAPNTRKRYVDSLAIAVAAFTKPARGRPDERVLRKALTTYLLPTNRRKEPPEQEELRIAAEWITRASRPIRELADEQEVTPVLQALGKNLNGRTATAWSMAIRRSALNQALKTAVNHELATNPTTGIKITFKTTNDEVDPRVVINPAQAEQVLAAVTYAGRRRYMYAFFASMYYAALRPAEANRLKDSDCKLPESGWGELVLEKSIGLSNARYSDTGQIWEERGLKRRGEGSIRRVPIPPQLVTILRDHIARFGTTSDGRLFHSPRNDFPINAKIYTIAWDMARKIGFSPAQYASPLASTPYDLRHAALSTWLAAGVPPAEVAERAGHTVDVLLTVYAQCLDGQRDTSNTRIANFLDGKT